MWIDLMEDFIWQVTKPSMPSCNRNIINAQKELGVEPASEEEEGTAWRT